MEENRKIISPDLENTYYEDNDTDIKESEEVIDEEESVDIDEKIETIIDEKTETVELDNITETLKNKFKDIDPSDIYKLFKLVNRHLNGELNIKYYDELPIFLQNKIMSSLSTLNTGNLKKLQITSLRNKCAKDLIDEISLDVSFKNVDEELSELNSKIELDNDSFKKDLGKMTIDAHIKSTLEYIRILEEKIDTDEYRDKANDIRYNIITPIKDSLNLSDFIEFCKRVKIKNYDLENPNHIYKNFNHKYTNNQEKSINNIMNIPNIIINFSKTNEKVANSICIAFCKYCLNYNPNNDNEHTFMYYFMRNIMSLEYLYVYPEYIEEDYIKEFYDIFNNSFNKCIEIFTERYSK